MSTDSDDKLVEIGVVGRAHGIGGAINIFLHNPESTILKKLDRVLLEDDSGLRTVSISECRVSAKKRIIVFEGVSNRTEAEQLKGAKLLIPRSSLPRLPDDEFYIDDLIGAEVWDNDALIGTVTGSRPQGDVEMITVTSESYSVEVPLVEDFVISVDCKSGIIQLTDTDLLPTFPVKRPSRKK